MVSPVLQADSLPGLGKVFKDLDTDVTGIEAVEKTTIGERQSQMGL